MNRLLKKTRTTTRRRCAVESRGGHANLSDAKERSARDGWHFLRAFTEKMWHLHREPIDPSTVATSWSDAHGILSFREVIDLLKDSEDFRAVFADGIAGSQFEALFWETPPVTKKTLDRRFECVLVEGGALQRLRPDPTPFRSHFSASPMEPVLTFPNLGRDAVLVVPTPMSDEEHYTHLARFIRGAPREQVDAFWRSVGHAMDARISRKPTWLSTAGLGVSWLHLRLDSRPKYYRHTPYKKSV